MDEYGIWLEDHNFILQVFSQEFQKHFKKDRNNYVQMAVPFSRDISDEDNSCLTREAMMEEV